MAGKMRVHELAKELGLSSKEILAHLDAIGVTGKSVSSSVEDALARQVRDRVEKAKRGVPAKPAKAGPKAKAGAPKEKAAEAKPKAPARKPTAKQAAPTQPKAPPSPPEPGEAVEAEKPVKKRRPAKVIPFPAPEKAPAEREGVAAPAAPGAIEVVKEATETAVGIAAPEETAAPVPPPPPEVAPPKEVRRELLRLLESVTVAELAEKMRRKASEVIKELVGMGVMVSINQLLDLDKAKAVAARLGFDLEVRSLEGEELIAEELDPSQLRPRPPVVTVMGHVDHGKTSLLDAIRKTRVTEQEFGGITQHIGAYQVETAHGKVTFLDTPGHEAFTAMRARGAQVTDIVILVVAADDGVMPQTVEAINHARAANVPILVAINKIDKPEANQDRVKQELANHGLIPEEWGGQTIFVETSAKKGTGIDNLLEMSALQAEIMELKANPNRAAKGVVIEARLERGRGPVSTVLIRQGTLREGDVVVAGRHSGRVRAMFNHLRQRVKQADPADPVEILGLSGVPSAGDTLVVVDEERKARQIAFLRQEQDRRKGASSVRVTLEDLHKQIAAGEVKECRLILKGDVHGSLEALQEALERLSTDEVKVRVLHGAVGTVTESDIMLASASNAIVLGFNVPVEPKAVQDAQAEGVDVRTYNVIYEAINDIKAALAGMLAPLIREVPLGKAQIRALFPIQKVGTIAGCYVTEGKVVRNARVRLVRDGAPVGEGQIGSLKRFKDDAREVVQGLECGIGVEGVTNLRVGDLLEIFTTEEVARTL